MNEKKGLSTNSKILIVGFVVLIAAIAVAAAVIIYMLNSKEPPAEPAAGGNLVIDEGNLEEVKDRLTESVKEGMYELNMTTTWSFPDGKTSQGVYLANGTANSYPVSFELMLNGTEQIYSSTVIPVGKQIKEIVLDKELEPGTYEAVCMYHLWYEDGTENSSFGVNVELVVGE